MTPEHVPRQKRIVYLVLFALIMLAGCQRVPSVNVAGSYFPDWIFCSLAGIIGAALSHVLFVRLKMEAEVQPGVLIYPCIALSGAVTAWLLWSS
jgi:uncharacterized membrane protein YeaQ/YmgE (transglycosylase-associated protein family)